MLHIVTVHYRSPAWIPIQARYLRANLSVPYSIWTSLEGIDPAFASHFDHVLEQQGTHAAKLNHLAMEITHAAEDEDLIMFLDGDAFPIADPLALIEDGLRRAPLIAVRRAENVDEPQPHPCFCVTTVRTWRTLPGDWTAGPTWIGAHGRPTSDVGANLLRKLELSHTPWVQVLRTNTAVLDPLHFAIYGGAIYHHGAGFRAGELSPAHRDLAPASLNAPSRRLLRAPARLANGLRWRAWERSTRRRLERESARIFAAIERGGDDWLEQLR